MLTRPKRVLKKLKDKGLSFVFQEFLKDINREKIDNFGQIKQLFKQGKGLEVGGPSGIFRDRGFIPIYRFLNELDGCNFSNSTIWEGSIENGKNYNYYKNKNGFQFISEASDLSLLPDAKYDFVISSNCLEHVSNPLKAVKEWVRVVKKGGLVLIVLPNKAHCFDHRRPDTSFSHLLEDFKNDTQEDDLTHLEEILALHDLQLDVKAGTPEQFKERSMNNFQHRAMHHHVFSIALLEEIYRHFGLEILQTAGGKEHIILGRKTN